MAPTCEEGPSLLRAQASSGAQKALGTAAAMTAPHEGGGAGALTLGGRV